MDFQKRSVWIKKIIFWSVIIGGLLALIVPSFIQVGAEVINPCDDELGLFCFSGIDNPKYKTGGTRDVAIDVGLNFAQLMIFLMAVVSVIFIIRNAWNMMNSHGQSDKFKQATSGVMYSLVGLMVAALSFTIVQLVINILTSTTL